MVPLGLDRFNEAGFFAPDGQREGVAIMLPKAFAILFALAGVTCWLAPGAIGGAAFSARESLSLGSLFFVVAAALFMIRWPDDQAP